MVSGSGYVAAYGLGFWVQGLGLRVGLAVLQEAGVGGLDYMRSRNFMRPTQLFIPFYWSRIGCRSKTRPPPQL